MVVDVVDIICRHSMVVDRKTFKRNKKKNK